MTPAQQAHIMVLVRNHGELSAERAHYLVLRQSMATIEAALRDAPQAEGWVMVPVEVIAFLKGEKALEGKFFGEPDPFTKGRFWWRKYLAETPSAPTAVDPDERDTERMNWLDNNIFHVEPDQWTRTHYPHLNTWRIFAPKGVQGSARAIIDAARASKEQPWSA